jgi:4-amino-4-deoxy-L-arabinose transferase-like glycosyltransferase
VTTTRQPASPAAIQRPSRLPLVAILALAFALRLASVALLTGAIDVEGAEYARIAQNLLSGKGYYGILTPGKELMFPPLFPYLIAATSLLTGNVELAGRLVSSILGALLVLPIFFITRLLYDRSAAYIAALLTAVHPFLVLFSATVYCESTYMTLLLAGVYGTLRGFQTQTPRVFALTALAYSLAYLTRPEAVVYTFLTAGFTLCNGLLARQHGLPRLALRLVALPVVFAAFALPYIVWLHDQTGQWRLEGKGGLNYAIGLRIMYGESSQLAQHGVGGDLTEHGVWTRSHLSTIETATLSVPELLHYVRGKVNDVAAYLERLPMHSGFGAPPLFLLAVFGLFRGPWDRKRGVGQLFLLTVLAISSSALLFMYFYVDRYVLLFLPVSVIWASQGIWDLARWASVACRTVFGPVARPALVQTAAACLVASTVPLLAMPVALETAKNDRKSEAVQAAGEWLDGFAPGPKTVMDASPILSFHSGATFMPFPYCDADVAMRYLDSKNVDFLVLSEYNDLASRPYLQDWMTYGPPGGRAQLVWSNQASQGGRILIYSWNPVASEPRVTHKTLPADRGVSGGAVPAAAAQR